MLHGAPTPRHRKAIQSRHAQVEQHQHRIALARIPRQRRLATVDRRHRVAQATEHGVGHFAIDVIVVDHQDMLATAERQGRGGEGRSLERRGAWQRQLEPEAGTLARALLEAQSPAHQLDQPPRDRKPESGTAEAARGGGIALGKGLEQLGGLFFTDSDAGVIDLEAHAPRRQCLDQQTDTPLLGELEGIGEQIEQHLTQTHRIAHDLLGQLGGAAVIEDDARAVHLRQQQVDHAIDGRVQFEGASFDAELAGLDLGEVEDIIHQPHQHFAAVAQAAGIAVRTALQRFGQQQLAHADHAIERGANLVAHGGQKLGLGATGLFGPRRLVLEGRRHRQHLQAGLFTPAGLQPDLTADHQGGQQHQRQQQQHQLHQAVAALTLVGQLLCQTCTYPQQQRLGGIAQRIAQLLELRRLATLGPQHLGTLCRVNVCGSVVSLGALHRARALEHRAMPPLFQPQIEILDLAHQLIGQQRHGRQGHQVALEIPPPEDIGAAVEQLVILQHLIPDAGTIGWPGDAIARYRGGKADRLAIQLVDRPDGVVAGAVFQADLVVQDGATDADGGQQTQDADRHAQPQRPARGGIAASAHTRRGNALISKGLISSGA